MQVRERGTAVNALRAAIAAREAREPRAPGLHLSQIVDDAIETIYGDRAGSKDQNIGLDVAFWEFGNAWETTMATGLGLLFPDFVKPSPLQCEGVWCSLDGWQSERRRVHEIKLTWTSSRDGHAHPKVLKYFWQAMGYAYAQQTADIMVHVGYVRGNYMRPEKEGADRAKHVDVRTYVPQVTPQAVVQHWRMLMQHARDRGWR